jgi:hypothetical protein
MSGWALQCGWRDVVQQLQRRVRVSGRLQQLDTSGTHVWCGPVLGQRRGSVQ